MKRITREWVQKAEADLRGARKLAPSQPPMHDLVCFCCQQSAEKYLKAVLVELGGNVPRTHNLEDLLGLLLPDYPHLAALRRGLKFLIQFAVEARYPGFHATKAQAAAALRWAERAADACRLVLGIRSKAKRRKSL
jgi:HEPN domain-containing protein